MKTSIKNNKKEWNNLLAQPLRSAAMLAVGCSFFLSCSSEASENYYEDYKATASEAPATEQPADDGKGIGPVKEVQIAAIDPQLADKGKALFEAKCAACHQMSDQKIVGPGLAGVTERRKPEWVMNMIINPVEMTQKDPTAKKLLAEHLTQMTNQNVNEEDARAMLEYLRQNDANN
ncbi:MAG: cytochrome c [Hymenobacteraceae bacterium]|nr:cytochrome c [Hymenobacteraceae bacterium]MDX5394874.1 cytochrome c [Hymenobacteraceae bacterium]MDX5444382.1 cytochrome c [Hymenobacteraceae bacterium]MDX5510909.1 cytochrome c [Hymenobacteraceae bacterium]